LLDDQHHYQDPLGIFYDNRISMIRK
jgi:hypothetical protein